jgi:hypothetical protein
MSGSGKIRSIKSNQNRSIETIEEECFDEGKNNSLENSTDSVDSMGYRMMAINISSSLDENETINHLVFNQNWHPKN